MGLLIPMLGFWFYLYPLDQGHNQYSSLLYIYAHALHFYTHFKMGSELIICFLLLFITLGYIHIGSLACILNDPQDNFLIFKMII